MSTTTAVFKVDGRHYTNLARSMVLDGDWRDALTHLIDGIYGMNFDIAFMLLKGTHTLVGVNEEMTMIEETDEDYQSDVRDIYCDGKFYEMNELYSFVKFIDQTVIDKDIRDRDLNYKIPASDEYVRTYLLPADMFVFKANSEGKHYRGLIAEKLDCNSLPLWLTKDDFCTSAKIYANKHYPIPVVKREKPVSDVKAVVETEKTVQAIAQVDWHSNWRANMALNNAKDHGFDNVIDFSNHLRAAVLEAIKERNGSWKTIAVKYADINESITFPYELALAYALSKTGLRHLAPTWKTVSPGELKMGNDSRLHSDLWLALGFNIDGREYDDTSLEFNLFTAVVRKMQHEVFPMGEFDTLNSAGLDSFSGTVVTPESEHIHRNSILVIPTAGPEYDVIARKAGLVICETGSRMAHLAVVGREFGLPLIRIEGACERFKEGVTLNIDFKTNTLTAHS
jgi:phosphohistidine swiveling domain-containing protein